MNQRGRKHRWTLLGGNISDMIRDKLQCCHHCKLRRKPDPERKSQFLYSTDGVKWAAYVAGHVPKCKLQGHRPQ